MKITAVIPRKHWLNIKTGQTASMFGAVPYTSEKDKLDWKLVTNGFTFQRSDGCVGIPSHAATEAGKTHESAIKFMNHFNSKGR
jgi:hypothetical protein